MPSEPVVILSPELTSWALTEEELGQIEPPKTESGEDIKVDFEAIIELEVNLGNQKYKSS